VKDGGKNEIYYPRKTNLSLCFTKNQIHPGNSFLLTMQFPYRKAVLMHPDLDLMLENLHV